METTTKTIGDLYEQIPYTPGKAAIKTALAQYGVDPLDLPTKFADGSSVNLVTAGSISKSMLFIALALYGMGKEAQANFAQVLLDVLEID